MIAYNPKGTLSPRLAKVMAKLARIIRDEDLMAFLVVSDGKTSDYFCPLDPDWSACRFRPVEDGGLAIHIHSKREDYKTAEEQKEHIERTVNGLALMFQTMDTQRGNLAIVMRTLQDKLQIIHTGQMETRPAPKPCPPEEQPKTLVEAAARLMATLDSDQKMWVLQKPLYEALPEVHHGFGTELRNSWNLWADDCPLRQHVRETYGLFGHADDLSTLIFTALWAVVRGTDPVPDLEAEVMGMKAHWRSEGINPETGEKGLVL